MNKEAILKDFDNFQTLLRDMYDLLKQYATKNKIDISEVKPCE